MEYRERDAGWEMALLVSAAHGLKTVGRQGILSVSDASIGLLEVPGRICVCGLGTVQDLGHRRLVQNPENKDSYRIFSKWLREGRRKGGGGERDRETAREREAEYTSLLMAPSLGNVFGVPEATLNSLQ